jgi:glycosyltransferase involved in cell wall biosynthesis
MKILLLSKYTRKGASSRLRTLQYLPYLAEHGFNVTVCSLFDDDYLKLLYTQGRRSAVYTARLFFKRFQALHRFYRYDVIWIEKEIFPYLPPFAERFLSLINLPYIVDYDDAIFHNYDLAKNPFIRMILGNKIDTVMRLSSHVIVGNKYLGARAKEAGARNVSIVPTVVDPARYTVKNDANIDQPILGWIGSPSTQKYVVNIKEALIKVCKTHNYRLLMVGADPQITRELPEIEVTVVPWSEENEADLIGQMDIGIMPIPDGPWEKGKCGYKLIQYMACGVPVVASPVGVNVQIVNDSQSGFLATGQVEWEIALLQLLRSPEGGKRLGASGRKAVENTYSLQVQAPVLGKIFNDVISGIKA